MHFLDIIITISIIIIHILACIINALILLSGLKVTRIWI